MSTKKYDIAIIGAGPGGFAAVREAHRLGARVVLIEQESVGGVCLHWGCIPTKTIIASARLYNQMKHSKDFGLQAKVAKPDMRKIIKRKRSVVEQLHKGMRFQLEKLKCDLLRGVAKIETPQKIRIKTDREEQGITAGKIIIASGSQSQELSVLPFDGRRVVDSKAILDMEELPNSLLIIGGGVIGCEFASMYKQLDTKVTIVEMQNRLLPLEDAEIGKRLATSFKKNGINVIVGDSVVSVEAKKDSVIVKTTQGHTVDVATVLVAIGRKPNIKELGLEPVGIEFAQGAIIVNECLETSVRGVYAIGDVINSPQLAHVAAYEGRIAVQNAVYDTNVKVDYATVPNCIFTTPEIATVGLTSDRARAHNISTKVTKSLYAANGKAHCIGAPEGFVKLVCDAQSGIIVGGQIMGEGASDLIAEIALAVRMQLTLKDLAETIHAHPTLFELIQEAAENIDLVR